MLRTTFLVWITAVSIIGAYGDARAETKMPSQGRFFHSGDGRLNLRSEKTDARFNGVYRTGPRAYDPNAYQGICRVFGAPCESHPAMSLRLIEFIDAVADHFNPGAEITITSGYRYSRYNTRLRKQGRLAAKASLHQYGMAADLKIAGVPSRSIWQYIKTLGFGGTGYYQGDTVHIDVGPARSWDEKSSGVGTGISDDNKLIGLVTDYDIYRRGEPVTLRFIRMTAFPIGVRPEMVLFRHSRRHGWEATLPFVPEFAAAVGERCPQFVDIEAMDGIRWQIPSNLSPGRYKIKARFCRSPWNEMPVDVTTLEFHVGGP